MASSISSLLFISKSLKSELVAWTYEQRSFYKGANILLMLKYITYILLIERHR